VLKSIKPIKIRIDIRKKIQNRVNHSNFFLIFSISEFNKNIKKMYISNLYNSDYLKYFMYFI